MATESTAIHDLLSGFGRKAIPDDPDDDVLFAGSRRRDGEAPAKQPSQQPRAGMFTLPPPPPPPPVVENVGFVAPVAPVRTARGTQPPPYLPPYVAPQRSVASPGLNKKLYAIPIGLFVIAVALAGVLLASGNDEPAAQVAASEAVEPVAAVAPAAVEPAAVEPVAVEPVAAVEAAPEPVAAHPVAPAEPAPPAPPRDVIAPPTVVPESAFTAKYEPTVPTVTSTPIEATKAEPIAVVAAAVPAVKAAPARSVKKSARELARERRAARAKRVAPRVAIADRPVKAAKAEKAGADLNGNGALAISSASPREVWVDGKNSKRMTPLRVLVKPGKHTVTLFDKARGTAKTFQVEVKPNATTTISK